VKKKLKQQKKIGIDEIILYTKDDFEEGVKKITNGEGVNAVYDGIGKSTFLKSLKCVKKRGTFVSFGNAGGKIDSFDPFLLAGSIQFTRPTLFDHILNRKELELRSGDLFNYVKEGKLDVAIHKIFDFSQAKEALQEIENRATIGKILLSFNKK